MRSEEEYLKRLEGKRKTKKQEQMSKEGRGDRWDRLNGKVKKIKN